MVKEISTRDLQTLLAEDTEGKVVVIDVREPLEFEGGHVAQAKNIPMGEVGEFVDALTTHEVVYFICRSGGRSGMVVRELAKRGVNGVNVDGGMIDWQVQNFPIV